MRRVGVAGAMWKGLEKLFREGRVLAGQMTGKRDRTAEVGAGVQCDSCEKQCLRGRCLMHQVVVVGVRVGGGHTLAGQIPGRSGMLWNMSETCYMVLSASQLLTRCGTLPNCYAVWNTSEACYRDCYTVWNTSEACYRDCYTLWSTSEACY